MSAIKCTGLGTSSSSIASPYGSDPSCVGMAMAPPPLQYPDSVQQVSLMPYPSSLPAVPSVGSPQGYPEYYSTPAASQPTQSGGALYLQPVAPSPEYGAGSSALPAYTGYPCVQYSPMVLSPQVYSVQAATAGRPTLVGPAPGPAYTVPPPPVVVQQSPMDPPTAVAVPPAATSHTPLQLVPVQGQLLCNVARVQTPQVAARPMVAGTTQVIFTLHLAAITVILGLFGQSFRLLLRHSPLGVHSAKLRHQLQCSQF